MASNDLFSKQAEQSLINAVLMDTDILDGLNVSIGVKDFYHKRHQDIWKAILTLRDKNPKLKIDSFAVISQLTADGTLESSGGEDYIKRLENSLCVSSNVEYYADVVRKYALRRRLKDLGTYIAATSGDETHDIEKLIDETDSQFTKIGFSSSEKFQPFPAVLRKALQGMEDRFNGKNVGIMTGFKDLNEFTNGFKPSELIIIGARPSIGKTAFALSLTSDIVYRSKTPVKVGFFSLEMSGSSLIERMLSRGARVPHKLIASGCIDSKSKDKIVASLDWMSGNLADNLLIQDSPNMKITDIKSQIRQIVRNDGVQIVFIDYIGLIDPCQPANVPRHEQISYISRTLKGLARELNIAIVCLSQVNRDAGRDRPPMLSDLRESGAIEQDADIVLLLDDPSKRLDKTGVIQDYNTESCNRKEKDITVIVAKQRNGRTGAFNLVFESDYVSFVDKSSPTISEQ